jgi:hypothetical protein
VRRGLAALAGLLLALCPAAARAATGDLDPSFGSGGKASFTVGQLGS